MSSATSKNPDDQYQPEHMVSKKYSPAITVLMACVLFLAGSAAAYSGIQTVIGDEVTISGAATSGPYVYLFLTGPNLPENGVALHDITKRADRGYFTKVSVDGDRWSYTWHTGSINGKLDEGTYTLWVVSGPNDRSRLAQADYRTISVTLGKPFITVDTPVQPGSMDLQSVPDGASVTVNGDYRGKTPLVISGLSPSTYTVSFSRPGFLEMYAQVIVQGGRNSEVIANLQPETGSLAVNSTPSGARVLLDQTFAGLSPVVLLNTTPGNHTITLEKDGYVTTARQVSLAFGQQTPVDVVLVPVPTAVPPATQAAGLVPAMAGAVVTVLGLLAYSHRRTR
ncbi:MAG: PEGA domain-containing protein [Methanoregula sp.]|jgi:hypothetical protein|nr:PEGA domain-containing protein [Methanoregula sp.]